MRIISTRNAVMALAMGAAWLPSRARGEKGDLNQMRTTVHEAGGSMIMATQDPNHGTPPLTPPDTPNAIGGLLFTDDNMEAGVPALTVEDGVFVLDNTVTNAFADEMVNTAPIPTPPVNRTFGDTLRALAIAAIIAIEALVPSRGEDRRAQSCAGHDSDDGQDHAPLWPWIRKAISTAFTDVASAIKAAARKVRNLARDANPVNRVSRWLKLAEEITVQDMPTVPGDRYQDCQSQLEKDLPRLHISSWWKTEAVRRGVHEICSKVSDRFPNVGYNQGFDTACQTIFLAVDRNIKSATEIYTKWAVVTSWFIFNDLGNGACMAGVRYAWSVLQNNTEGTSGWLASHDSLGYDGDDALMAQSLFLNVFMNPLTSLCGRLDLREKVVLEIVEKTLKAGIHGPAVTLWTMTSLLCLAEKAGASTRADAAEDLIMIFSEVQEAARDVQSFAVLEEAAPISLEEFMVGFCEATEDFPTASPSD